MHFCFQGASGSGWAVDFEAHLECKELIAAVRTVVVPGPCRHGHGGIVLGVSLIGSRGRWLRQRSFPTVHKSCSGGV